MEYYVKPKHNKFVKRYDVKGRTFSILMILFEHFP